MAMTLHSPAFENGGPIPARYTGEGEDVSPPLSWEDAPDGTQSFVLIVDDPDAPDPKKPRMVYVHWVVAGIPPDRTSLPEGVSGTPGIWPAQEGMNDWKRTQYGGPYPPIGRHRYFHKLYALDTRLDLPVAATKPAVEAAMKGHILAAAELVGTYEKRH